MLEGNAVVRARSGCAALGGFTLRTSAGPILHCSDAGLGPLHVLSHRHRDGCARGVPEGAVTEASLSQSGGAPVATHSNAPRSGTEHTAQHQAHAFDVGAGSRHLEDVSGAVRDGRWREDASVSRDGWGTQGYRQDGGREGAFSGAVCCSAEVELSEVWPRVAQAAEADEGREAGAASFRVLVCTRCQVPGLGFRA